MRDEKPFMFAGICSFWKDPRSDDERASYAIITTIPNSLMAGIHNRMPVILPEKHFDQWLDPEHHNTNELKKLLAPYPDKEMKAYPVSRLVNNSHNDVPECLEPLDPVEKQSTAKPNSIPSDTKKKQDRQEPDLFSQAEDV
jgi:putative SOS response-associated peptidase YedK